MGVGSDRDIGPSVSIDFFFFLISEVAIQTLDFKQRK